MIFLGSGCRTAHVVFSDSEAAHAHKLPVPPRTPKKGAHRSGRLQNHSRANRVQSGRENRLDLLLDDAFLGLLGERDFLHEQALGLVEHLALTEGQVLGVTEQE